jgi:hypothetical protein
MLVTTFKTGAGPRHFQDNIIREGTMLLHRLSAWLLRPLLYLLALCGLLSLAACGGGSGAPNNPYQPGPSAPPPLVVQPASINVYSGVPTTLTIVSGVAPFTVFSDTPSILPVAQAVAGNTVVLLANQVGADASVRLTVRDAVAQSVDVPVTVKPAPLFNNLTFAPSGGDCGADLCSAQTGTARVVALAPGGAPLIGRQIRFDVVYGPVAFNTGNPAQPQTQTVTVVTDNAGAATAVVQALPNSTTQPAQIRATDVTTGNQQIANFTVVNNTTANQSPIVVVPNTANITGPDKNTCSAGFRVDYYVYGGTPPYRVQSTFPQAVTLSNNVVSSSGGFFSATTNGSCVKPLVFTVVDSAGKQTTATLTNDVGTADPVAPPPSPALAVTPATMSDTCVAPTGDAPPLPRFASKTYEFVITGGTPSYNVVALTNPGLANGNNVVVSPNVVATAGGKFTVTTQPSSTAATDPFAGKTISLLITDVSSPAKTVTATLTCQ